MQDVGCARGAVVVGDEVVPFEERVAAGHGQVAVGHHHGIDVHELRQRVGVKQGQARRTPPAQRGVVYAQDVESSAVCQRHEVSPLRLAVHHEVVLKVDAFTDALPRHGHVRGQERELLAAQQSDGHGAVCPHQGEEVGVVAPDLVADGAVLGTAVAYKISQGFPGVEECRAKGLAAEAVHPDSVVVLESGTTAAEDDGVVPRSAEYIRKRARLRDGLHVHGGGLAVEELDAVVGIPVAGDDHPSAVQLHSRWHGALAVETTEAGEAVEPRVVGLHGPQLPYSEVLAHAARQEHQPGGEPLGQGEVGRVGHVHQVPLAVGVVLRRLGGHEAIRVASDGGEFAVEAEEGVVEARHLHIGQALERYVLHGTGEGVGS